ncbi:TIGR01177 family methyltransferase [Methanocaldococcus indicus]|uniref:TIGR01177 family methyltransferase n=1 Tax=Methanocaldococcus indicus TaxID=213231 RepID=UPI003C6CDEBA
MRVGYKLSGEHKSLPYEELKALLELYNYKNSIHRLGRYVITKESYGKEIVDRAGYIDESHEILYIHNNLNLNEFYNNINNLNFQINGSFAVRTLKLDKEYCKDINSLDVEREVGRIIKEKTNAKVNLSNPDNLIKVVFLRNRIILGKVIAQRDREYFKKNRPHLRKFFHPGCILPKLARAMVNLARVKEGDIVLDPFCGTGGFLIEAGLLGAKLIGVDIDWRMAKGTLINLEEYNLLDRVIKVECLDSKNIKEFLNNLGIDKVDAIITDPPYGISTAKKGEIEKILNILIDVLKDDGYFVFAYNRFVKLDLELKNLFKIYIHKNLIRHIHIYHK